MAGFEDLIRGTLERHGDASPEKREAVYNSSRQALERMLTRNDNIDAAAKDNQRKRLEDAIAVIEAGYMAGSPLAAPGARQDIAQPTAPSAPLRVAPVSDPPPPTSRRVPASLPGTASRPIEPVAEVGAAPAQPQDAIPTPEKVPAHHRPVAGDERQPVGGPVKLEDFPGLYSERTSRERRPFAKLLLWTIIIAGIGVSVWWAINFGPALVQQQLGGAVPNPGQTIESGQFVPESERGWITAFNPSEDSDNVLTGDRGTASLYQDDSSSFIRMASNPGSTDNNIRILIPRGVLIPLRGEAATIELLIKNSSDAPHQIAVFCEFSSMGSCGRKRFDARDRAEAQIFDVILNDVELAANEDAFISINTDLAGDGKSIDLYTIRFRANR